MPSFPITHVQDAHKLIADGKVDLFQIMPVSGGTLYLKGDADFTYLGVKYEGIPIGITGEKFSADVSTPTPRMVIGQDNLDLLPFKGLMHDGYLDGARVVRYRVLLDDMLKQLNSKQISYFRVKRVENYSRSKISLLLSTMSGALSQTFPFRQYTPPAFPWVDIN